ncbi:hypothetical protein [Fonticella tunisiensis]|uniref:Uncharacterized protein n=1 Tax=Fonticella tunisiensis TaxID=1096341 RepID=A0A4R7KB25_9CLOT|nr:hypothetical protein [Fonticella tunisiensis]TDT51070.1 hypothetical protein EDD71_12240 [Fonticella tunisiensis]
MLKKISKKILVLSLTLIIGIGSTAFAVLQPVPDNTDNSKKKIEEKKERKEAQRAAFDNLINQLGLTKHDIENARASNKTLFDLAKTKGYTPDQVREMMIKNETDLINKHVSQGKLTQEQGKIAIEKMKERIKKWDGSLSRRDKGHGWVASIKELGLTEKDIADAKKSGKTLFDLAKEKKGFSPEQVKSIIIKSKTEAINKMVSEGKLTKEEGERIISKIKKDIEKWNGSLNPHKHDKNGNSQ